MKRRQLFVFCLVILVFTACANGKVEEENEGANNFDRYQEQNIDPNENDRKNDDRSHEEGENLNDNTLESEEPIPHDDEEMYTITLKDSTYILFWRAYDDSEMIQKAIEDREEDYFEEIKEVLQEEIVHELESFGGKNITFNSEQYTITFEIHKDDHPAIVEKVYNELMEMIEMIIADEEDPIIAYEFNEDLTHTTFWLDDELYSPSSVHLFQFYFLTRMFADYHEMNNIEGRDIAFTILLLSDHEEIIEEWHFPEDYTWFESLEQE